MVILKKIGVLKSAIFLGLFGLFMGIIMDLFLLIFSAVISSIFSSFGGSSMTMGSLFGALGNGILFYILIPLSYGIIGFLGGLIFTPVMNLTLKIIHGLYLDMVE